MKHTSRSHRLQTLHEVALLAREAQDNVGEDNVAPWLRVHHHLMEASVRGYCLGLRAAIEGSYRRRN